MLILQSFHEHGERVKVTSDTVKKIVLNQKWTNINVLCQKTNSMEENKVSYIHTELRLNNMLTICLFFNKISAYICL